MEIVEKKVITKYEVEIGFNEFWETLNDILDYWLVNKEVKPIEKRHNDYYKKLINANIDLYKGKCTLEQAKNIFKDLMDDMVVLVISQIAEDNGYEVSHYGIYDKILKVRTATFIRKGNHI